MEKNDSESGSIAVYKAIDDEGRECFIAITAVNNKEYQFTIGVIRDRVHLLFKANIDK